MRSACSIACFCFFLAIHAAGAQQQSKVAPKILSAKTAYVEDHLGSMKVTEEILARLKKWGRFQVVNDPKDADVVLLFTTDPYVNLTLASGRTGTMDKNGNVQEDRIPNFFKLSPVRYAYLTVVDPVSKEKLWDAEHQWGGLLTGFNSVGARLVAKLQKDMKK
jgi:hypothetical protein